MSAPTDTPTTDSNATGDAHGASSAGMGGQRHRTGPQRTLAHARLIARTELRRRRRAFGDNTRMLLARGIMALFGLLFIVLLVGGAYSLGTFVGTDTFADALPFARGAILAVCGYAGFMVGIRTIQNQTTLDAPAAILTATSPAAAALGLLLSEYAVVAGIAVLPILAAAVAFAASAGSLASVVIGPVVLLTVLAFGVVVGDAIGLAIKNVVTRFAVIARFKTILGVAVFLAYLAIIWSGAADSVVGPLFGVVEATPLGWFADLALVGTADPAIGLARPVAAAATLVVGIPLLTWVIVRLDSGLWYTDPVQPSQTSSSRPTNNGATAADVEHAESSGFESSPANPERTPPSAATSETLATGLSDRLFAERVPQSVLRVAQKSWRRTYRAPRKLQYAIIPVFFLINPIQRSIQSGTVAAVLPVSIAIYGAWAAGAAFTLNPLGDEGAVLPITLTASVSGQQVLSGLVLAGVAVGAPLTGVLAAILGMLSPLSVLSAVAFGVLGVVLCVGACTIGVGIGTAFPKFERTRISRSRKVIVPSLSAFVVYSLALLVVSLPGLLAGIPLVADWVGTTLGVPQQTIPLGGLVLTVVLAVVGGWIATRSAGNTIDNYRM